MSTALEIIILIGMVFLVGWGIDWLICRIEKRHEQRS